MSAFGAMGLSFRPYNGAKGKGSHMSDYETTLAVYRAQIAALEARALETRLAGFNADTDYETNQRKADRLEEEARGLRILLPEIMRVTFGEECDDETEAEEPDDKDDRS